MKCVSFSHGGRSSWGCVVNKGIVDLGAALGQRAPTLKAALAAGLIAEAASVAGQRAADFGLDDVRFLPVVPDPDKIFCVGLNYESHRIEANLPPMQFPTIFMRVAASQTAHREAILRPRESQMLDFEGELAIVIGRGGRRIKGDEAGPHIAGYALYNDGSVRDWQRHTPQWGPGKNFNLTGAFGPWLVTRDEIADGTDLSFETRLNGTIVQRGTSSDMIFSFSDLVEYISTFTTLAPGDVIVTGTPAGVGAQRTPPLFMNEGDRVEIHSDQLGTLVNVVAGDEN